MQIKRANQTEKSSIFSILLKFARFVKD